MVRTRAASVRAPCAVCALTLIGEAGTICTVCDKQCHTRCVYVREYETKCITCTTRTRAEESKAQKECDAMVPYGYGLMIIAFLIYVYALAWKRSAA